MAFASWWTWPPVEWARWMWTTVTGSGDSSLQVLQGNSGKRQVVSVYLFSTAPDVCEAGGQGDPRGPPRRSKLLFLFDAQLYNFLVFFIPVNRFCKTSAPRSVVVQAWILNFPPRQKLSPLILTCVCESQHGLCRVCMNPVFTNEI